MQLDMQQGSAGAGFSLMELLVAVSIVAILASVVLPNFRDALQRGRRVDAITALLDVQIAQERWRANHTSYASLDALGLSGTSADGHYQLNLDEPTAGSFFATAVPVADGPQHDDECGSYALDQRGPVLTIEYADDTCWRR